MTFLNPFALLGLAAAAIPILLHFFNLRKLRTIEFSTLSFLKELQRTKIRRLKLRQLLLLFLRTLLVVLIVLAFSRPTLKGSLPGSIAQQAKTTAVIILDDSQSMTADDEQGELLTQAKNAAAAIINLLKNGDEVFLVKLSEVPTIGTTEIPTAQRNLPAIRSTINDIKPSFIHRKIEDALRFSSRLLATSKNFNKEVYIISDFQMSSLESTRNLPTMKEAIFSNTTHIFLVPLGRRELQNVAIEAINIPNAIIEINKSLTVKAKIANYGPAEILDHVISVFQDGSRATQKGIDIPSGRAIDVEFTLMPKRSGYLDGMIELEDDDLEFDNKHYFTIRIPEEIKVLLIGNQSDLRFIRLALSTRLSDSNAALKVSETTWDRFSTSQTQNTDVIVFSNPHELTQSQSTSLKVFLQNGGGLMLFPGNHLTTETFNTTIATPLGIPLIAAQEKPTAQIQINNSFIEFDKCDLRHPIFSGMFEDVNSKQSSGSLLSHHTIESPRISNSVHFVPTPRSQTIITLTNGFPFLTEEKIGNGRALIVGVAANTEWSDLPLKGLFVPLIHRSISYLAQPSTVNKSLTAGDEVVLNIRTFSLQRSTIVKPDNTEVIVKQISIGNTKIIRFSDTNIPGIYLLKIEGALQDKFSINTDASESNITTANDSQKERLLKRLGIPSNTIHMIAQPQEIQRTIIETRFGAELWKHFFIVALFVAFIEMLVARESKSALSLATGQID